MSAGIHVVLGAGQVGARLLRLLHARGLPVRSVSRTGAGVPAGVDVLRGDLLDPEVAARAADGAAVLYLCLNAPYRAWAEVLPRMQSNVVAAAARSNAKIVALENMYAYGPTRGRALREDLPLSAVSGKGAVRRVMAEQLMETHRSGLVRTTSARAADLFGPGVSYGPSAELFRRAIRGEAVSVPFTADLPHSLSYLPDVAHAMMVLGASDRADGRSWHVPNPPALSVRELLRALEPLTGRPLDFEVVPEGVLEHLSQSDPDVRELWEIRHFYTEPYLVDHSDFAAEFGDVATGWAQALPETLAWYSSQAVPPGAVAGG